MISGLQEVKDLSYGMNMGRFWSGVVLVVQFWWSLRCEVGDEFGEVGKVGLQRVWQVV